MGILPLLNSIVATIVMISSFPFASNYNLKNGPITAKSYVLMEDSTGEIMAEKGCHTKLPMASTTKIMTAFITLSQPKEKLQEEFLVDSTAIKVEGSSMGLRVGDRASLLTLAIGMLLPSGNDAANAAAVRISGSIKNFVELMNETAKSIGMNDTHFVTPSGLDDDEHYSSAYDMALLTRTALKNTTFAQICSSAEMAVDFGNHDADDRTKRTLKNHNRLLTELDGCIGVKTGFTKKAGRCLVSAAKRDGFTLICVTLGAADDWNIHKNLYESGFSKLPKSEFSTNDVFTANVVGGNSDTVLLKEFSTVIVALPKEKLHLITKKVYIERFYYAPIKKGDILGEIHYIYNGNVIARQPLTPK